jgi:hypothetical protein
LFFSTLHRRAKFAFDATFLGFFRLFLTAFDFQTGVENCSPKRNCDVSSNTTLRLGSLNLSLIFAPLSDWRDLPFQFTFKKKINPNPQKITKIK